MSPDVTPSPEALRTTLNAYFSAIAAVDPRRIAAVFAEDGEIEDPVGSPVCRGRVAVEAYFSRGLGSLVSRAEIQVLSALPSGDSIAAHWTMRAVGKTEREAEGEGIDVLQVNAQGEIVRAEGYWNAAAFRQALAAR